MRTLFRVFWIRLRLRANEETASANRLVRKLVDIASLFVKGFYFEDYSLAVQVQPSWRKGRYPYCGKPCPGYESRNTPVLRWVHLALGGIRLILEYMPRELKTRNAAFWLSCCPVPER